MESFLLDLLKIFLTVLFLLGAVLVSIWYYFRIRPASLVSQPGARTGEPSHQVFQALKYQACERLVLLLERITPNNLILRVHTSEMTIPQLQTALIKSVREEFEYNLSQQLYVSRETWELIRNAKEDTIRLINTATANLTDQATSRDLAAEFLYLSISQESSPVTQALNLIKQEIH